MRREIAEQWVVALESGNYLQGTGSLNKGGKFCCLGVLCELAYQSGVVDKQETFVRVTYDERGSCLPDSVIEWAEMGSGLGEIPSNNISLTYLNDMLQEDFHAIAEIIRKNVDEL